MLNQVTPGTLAIIGDEDIVIGFKALGFMIFPARQVQDLAALFEEIRQKQVPVCLVQDTVYKRAEGLINSYRQLPLPVFIPFARDGKIDLLDALIKGIRLRATGTL